MKIDPILLTAILGFVSGAVPPITNSLIQHHKKKKTALLEKEKTDIEITQKVRSVYGSIIADIRLEMELLKADVAYWKQRRCERDECPRRLPFKKP